MRNKERFIPIRSCGIQLQKAAIHVKGENTVAASKKFMNRCVTAWRYESRTVVAFTYL